MLQQAFIHAENACVLRYHRYLLTKQSLLIQGFCLQTNVKTECYAIEILGGRFLFKIKFACFKIKVETRSCFYACICVLKFIDTYFQTVPVNPRMVTLGLRTRHYRSRISSAQSSS
jgi:hypothetical protein